MSLSVAPRVFAAAETQELLPFGALIPAVGRAFLRAHWAPERVVIADEGQDWVVMPSLARGSGMFCKLLRVADGRVVQFEKPTMSGVAIALDADGRLVAVLDGATLTAVRTAAVAGFATSLLAREDASVLALFGAGMLAETHLEAIAAVRHLTDVRVVGRSPERLKAFCDRAIALGYPARPSAARAALEGVDIVVAVTTSERPVFADADLGGSVHINAMGSYRPERAEVPAETVVRARVVVEARESAWAEAGDLIQPRHAGLIDEHHVWAELREQERIAELRRLEPEAVTLFKSVGHVALDLAAFEVLLDQLESQDL